MTVLHFTRVAPVQLWQVALVRRQHATLRGRIVALAAYGHGGTAIARALGVPRGVVAGHLRSHRHGRSEKALPSRRWLEKAQRREA